LVFETLSPAERQKSLLSQAALMNLVRYENGDYVDQSGQVIAAADIELRFGDQVLDSTLVRRIEPTLFDPNHVRWNKPLVAQPTPDQTLSFDTGAHELPKPLPDGWSVEPLDHKRVRVLIPERAQFSLASYRRLAAQAAGQLPRGFDPGALYNSRFHPRGLQMTVVAASDAVHSTGIDWQRVVAAVRPDEIGVYAGSAMSQLDDNGNGGLLKSRLLGTRVTAKHLPLGFNTMPADFINAYVLGSVGTTSSTTGACATFLYNLRVAISDMQSGRTRVAVVGNSEAPLIPEIFDGYGNMGALASDDDLCKLDGTAEPNHRRASRPFGENCGFTLAESAQFVVLFDDSLAIELGANIHGAITHCFSNADGYKRSISAPGPGNYITVAKAVAGARSILGEESVSRRSYVEAHGSSTPQNRVTESRILDKIAATFSIENWPIAAVKAYVGHSIGAASADQLTSALGALRYGLIPGIGTIDRAAEDVHQTHLRVGHQHIEFGERGLDVCFINSKGFGGNNATATVLAPHIVSKMLSKRHGSVAMRKFHERQEETQAAAERYDQDCLEGSIPAIYRFGQNMIDETELGIEPESLKVPGFPNTVDLNLENPYPDMSDSVTDQ